MNPSILKLRQSSVVNAITSGMILVLTAMSTTTIAQPAIAPSVNQQPATLQPTESQLPRPKTNAQALRYLVGRWQGKSPTGETLTLLFNRRNQLFILFTPPASYRGSPVAQAWTYRISVNRNPMHMDLFDRGTKEIVRTIFNISPDGRLWLQLSGTNPGQARPTAFNFQNVTVLDKTSELARLPRQTRVIYNERPTTIVYPSEGQTLTAAINRAQQAYHLKNLKFATAIDELAIGLKPETNAYSYQILPQGDESKRVFVKAAAKVAGLKSYTGAVFVMDNNGEEITVSGICESNTPSLVPPSMPKPPVSATEPIQCLGDSHLIGGK